MTLGKGHLTAMLPLFAAAVAYNIWYFASGDETAASRRIESPEMAAASGPSVAGDTVASVDPTTIPPVPDVVLDKLPQWRRNPFVSAQKASPAVMDASVVEAVPAAEAEIVVEAIFTSAGRPARARVNGETVRVGDRIGTATVVDIQPRAIVIDSPSRGRMTVAPERRSASNPRRIQ